MLLGNLNKSNLLVMAFLFFGAISVGFTIIGETHYSIIAIIIGAFVHFFNSVLVASTDLTEEEDSFGRELNNLSKMATYGLAPMTLLVKVTNGELISVIVSALFLVAVAIRLAHYNRPLALQGEDIAKKVQSGLPLVSIVIVLPILALLTYVVPTIVTHFLWSLSFIVVAIGLIIKVYLPKIPPKYQLAIMAGGLVAIILLLIFGPVPIQPL